MEYYLLQPYIARLLLIANFDSAVCSQLTLDHNNNNEKHGNVEAYIYIYITCFSLIANFDSVVCPQCSWITPDYNSEHRKMRAKRQHVCKEMNQYTNNTNRKWFLSFSIEWTIGSNDRK